MQCVRLLHMLTKPPIPNFCMSVQNKKDWKKLVFQNLHFFKKETKWQPRNIADAGSRATHSKTIRRNIDQHHLTCMTALNQQVFPMFFIPTGHSPALLHSPWVAVSPQTSQRFLFERVLLSAPFGSGDLPGNTRSKSPRKSHGSSTFLSSHSHLAFWILPFVSVWASKNVYSI